MKTLRPFALLIAVWLAMPGILFGNTLPDGFAAAKLADGLDAVALAQAPDGRLFVVEKFGQIRIIDSTGQLLPDPFLFSPVDNFNERGMLSVAIPSDFDSDPWVYLYYTVPDANHNRVSRVRAVGNYAAPGSEEILLELDLLNGPHHNAGAMLFGNDGMLYIATGDGTFAPNSQDFGNLLGKILRLRPDGSIPEDNPFYGQLPEPLSAIFALGLRNPYSMAYDPLSDRIFCGDVGSAFQEEINEILPGQNYGWPIIEGYRVDQPAPDNYRDPVYAYSHAEGCAVAGGAFYTPATAMFPSEYYGKYFFSDYCSGEIRVLDPATATTQPFATEINRPISLLTAPDGTMYYIARGGLPGGSPDANTASSEASVWRVFYTGNGAPFISVHPADQLVSVGEGTRFETIASGTPPFQYQWQLNDLDIPDAADRILLLPKVSLADSAGLYRCLVTNAEGSDTTRNAQLRVTSSQRPQPLILSPPDGSRYRAGDTIFFEGIAEDAEDGPLPAQRLRWKLDFHHDDHTHPAIGPTPGISEGYFVTPKVDETDPDVWFRFYLTARDESGLESTTISEIFPYKSNFYLNSTPVPADFRLDGNPLTTPIAVESVVGLLRDVEAPKHFYRNDSIYVFLRFANGSTENHFTYEVPMHDSTFIAYYEGFTVNNGTGLLGSYYLNPGTGHDFSGSPVLTRIDPEVDFIWSGLSPAPGQLPDSYYIVRWEGFLKPIFSGEHTLYLTTDDGSRLWIGDDLVFDLWFAQAPTEYSAPITFDKERYYPIRLEYFQDGGEATIRLGWEHASIGKSPIPHTQLYTFLPGPPPDETFGLALYPNPVREQLSLKTTSLKPQLVEWRIVNPLGQVVAYGNFEAPAGIAVETLSLGDFRTGLYYLVLEVDGNRTVWKVIRS